jgi:hypothetical protein
MKRLLTIPLLICSLNAAATNYYVKTGGSDVAAGTSDGTAWATIDKVNTEWAAGTFVAGDSILFNRGNSFAGAITVTESGTVGSPIIVGAYGTGADPIITGLQTISSWTSVGDTIYYATLTVESAPNMVKIDGVNTPMGRFPDSTYLIIDSFVTTTTITDAVLNSDVTDWTGAELVIRKNRWIIDRCAITDHVDQTLTYTTTTTYEPAAGYGYFIQNDLRTLTALGEWFWDAATNRLYIYFGAESPASYVVECSILDNNVNAITYDFLVFDNLDLRGANFASVNINRTGGDICDSISIIDCEMSFIGGRGVYAQYPQHITIDGCSITNANVSGILFTPPTSAADNYYNLTNNIISNVYLYPGMGTKVNELQGAGIKADGPNTLIEGNSITNIGYMPIYAGSTNLLVQNNYINTYGFVMDDCGGVYTFNDQTVNKRAYNNIILNGIGAGEGTPDGALSVSAHGLYTDGTASNTTFDGNIVGYMGGAGYHGNLPVDVTVTNNLFFQCAHFIELWKWTNAAGFITDMRITHNQFVSSEVEDELPAVIKYQNSASTYYTDVPTEIAYFGTIDSNYYHINTETAAYIIVHADTSAAPRSLARWTTDYGHDVHSTVDVMTTYTLNSIGSNLLTNGDFASNINGWTTTTGLTAAWDNTDEMGTGGSIQLTSTRNNYSWYWWSNYNAVATAITGGVVDSDNHYLLRFLGKSAVDEKTVSLRLYATGTGLSKQRFFTVGNTNTQKDVLFSFPTDVASGATMRLVMADDPVITYMDNIGLYVADVTLTDWDNYLHLIYNEEESNKTYFLSASMVDGAGITHNSSITLAPFEGMILLGNGTVDGGTKYLINNSNYVLHNGNYVVINR